MPYSSSSSSRWNRWWRWSLQCINSALCPLSREHSFDCWALWGSLSVFSLSHTWAMLYLSSSLSFSFFLSISLSSVSSVSSNVSVSSANVTETPTGRLRERKKETCWRLIKCGHVVCTTMTLVVVSCFPPTALILIFSFITHNFCVFSLEFLPFYSTNYTAYDDWLTDPTVLNISLTMATSERYRLMMMMMMMMDLHSLAHVTRSLWWTHTQTRADKWSDTADDG